MKKYILIALLSLITSAASAQKLTSGDFTATISNVKTRSYTQDVFGTIKDFIEFEGNYTIEKRGSQFASEKFSTLQIGKEAMHLNIRNGNGGGTSITYHFDTKKYTIMSDEFKAKRSKDIDNIILSGILIYAQWGDNKLK